MRSIPTWMTNAWLTGQLTGQYRPIARATVQRTHIISKALPNNRERYRTYLFGNPNPTHELPNVKSVNWQRGTDMDAGTVTITCYNTSQLPIGEAPDEDDEVYNQPGYFTFNRGDDPNRWNHLPNFWTHRLYPDMIIRTYEGLGFDEDVDPELDDHMLPSGVWLIDKVTIAPNGPLVMTGRDAGRIGIDEIAFPPVVPTRQYPLFFSPYKQVDKPKVPQVSGDSHWINPQYHDDSGQPYYGHNGSISGHRPSDAFDHQDSTYWLSVGNSSPTADYAFEWIEGSISPQTVKAVRVFVKGGPYRVYISLHTTDKGWIGSGTIPYDPSDPVASPNGADIPFIKSVQVDEDDDATINVRNTAHVDRIRWTFHHLWDSNIGTYQYRAAVRDVDVLVGETKESWYSPGQKWVGNYKDYSDIVKWLLGYVGFLWPNDPDLAFRMIGPDQVSQPPRKSDLVLQHLNPDNTATFDGNPIGDLWADVENSGTFGPSDLTVDIFDKKPIMDCITYIRDILAFIFFIDESGGAIFRSPNIWQIGNHVVDKDHRYSTNGHYSSSANSFVTIDERQTLMNLTATLDSKDQRERVVVANVSGKVGAVTKGFKPYGLPAGGFKRVAIWSDQHFSTRKECQIMADLIAIRQLFAYRSESITVLGNPSLQIDDQVKIIEETAEDEADLYYITGINATLDMSEEVSYEYQLTVQWLGHEPFGKWTFDTANLADDTAAYLRSLGKIT